MPRPPFSWLNIDNALLEQLKSDLRLAGDAAEALEREYGSIPKAEFIRDAWPTLLGFWLSSDPESCSIMATTLRSKGLGDIAIEEPLNYLRSCRNSQNLRDACVKLFIAKGKREIDSVARAQPTNTSTVW